MKITKLYNSFQVGGGKTWYADVDHNRYQAWYFHIGFWTIHFGKKLIRKNPNADQ